MLARRPHCDGIRLLMESDLEGGINIGRREYVSVDELVHTVASVAGKQVNIRHIDGPVGVRARNFRADRIAEIGWESRFSLNNGIAQTYPWIEQQVKATR